MDWMKKKVEMPKYIEEFSWAPGEAPEVEPLPEELEPFLGVGSKFFFLPKFDGLKEGYVELGLPSERVPEGMLDTTQLKEIAAILRLSLFQMEYEEETPVPKTVVIARAKAKGVRNDMDFIVSVKLPDSTIGFLSSQPDAIVAIPVTDLPSSLASLIKKNGNLVAV